MLWITDILLWVLCRDAHLPEESPSCPRPLWLRVVLLNCWGTVLVSGSPLPGLLLLQSFLTPDVYQQLAIQIPRGEGDSPGLCWAHRIELCSQSVGGTEQ